MTGPLIRPYGDTTGDGRVPDVAHVLQGKITIGEERGVDALGHHSDEQN